MSEWARGCTRTELERAQERFEIRFPPDLIDLFLERRPVDGHDWTGDEDAIITLLNWPLEMLLWDVEHGSWWTDWGERPSEPQDRHEVVRAAVAQAPRLIPIYSHRFIPETPNAAGNPVFSTHGFDTIYFGANLNEYFDNEFGDTPFKLNGIAPEDYTLEDSLALAAIPFWSDLALQWQRRIEVED